MEEETENQNVLNMKKKINRNDGKSTAFMTMPKTGDIAVVESILTLPEQKEEEASEEEVKEAIVYPNGMTSLDFMMPQDEREILEQNLNVYNDLAEMQKVLNVAKKNKKMSEDIKTLKIISDSTELINKMAEVMGDERSIEMLLKSFREKAEKGDTAKAYKELATTYKLFIDAREEMTKRLNGAGNKKSARIALKFTNDNGESFELGADV